MPRSVGCMYTVLFTASVMKWFLYLDSDQTATSYLPALHLIDQVACI